MKKIEGSTKPIVKTVIVTNQMKHLRFLFLESTTLELVYNFLLSTVKL